jgi:hypothetical protein
MSNFRFLRQIEAFYKKNAKFADNALCTGAAAVSFVEAEQQCSRTNCEIAQYISGSKKLDYNTNVIIDRVRRYINSVLGFYPDFEHNLLDYVKITSGATASRKRSASIPQLKLKGVVYATRAAMPYLSMLFRETGFNNFRILPTHSNRITLVAKSWKTHRTIACEPEGNLPLQLAFDKWTKKRLLKYGIDLSNQLKNQNLAKQSSVSNEMATLDFKAASDTIAYNVVAWLFPNDWFEFLCSVRSPGYRGVFGEGQYHKFSSMGNGTTFTIETLIFAAVCHALNSENYSVYGDDVLIESYLVPEFLRITKLLGFTINVEKSFTSGPFRESCGGDFYNGINVTPVYIRTIDFRKSVLSHIVNTVGRLTYPGSNLGRYLNSIVEEHKLLRVPWNDSTTSGVWIDPDEAKRLGVLCRSQWVPWGPILPSFVAYVPKTVNRRFFGPRGYYLWFIQKHCEVRMNTPYDDIFYDYRDTDFNNAQTSAAAVFLHKSVKKRVVWFQPHTGKPDHLLWLLRSSPCYFEANLKGLG